VVEQRPFKPKVVGSIPTAPTKFTADLIIFTLDSRGKGQDKTLFWSHSGLNFSLGKPGSTRPTRKDGLMLPIPLRS
jgi:hypothetical protein